MNKNICTVGFVVVCFGILLAGCDQFIAKTYGGTTTINLPCGQKYMNASWKENNIWYASRPAHPNEKFETIVYQESSQVGILQGKVLFVEKSCGH